MKAVVVVAFVIVAVLVTSAVWYVMINNELFTERNTNSTPTPTFHPTTPSPTHVPTSTPKPSQAPVSGTTKPSTLEFTLKFADYSYDVPPTYKTDPYIGKTVVDRSGYHVDNRTIDVTIKNQPFTSFSQNGNDTVLYYYILHKGHFEDWTGDSSINYPGTIQVSNTGSIVVSFSLQYWNIPPDGQVDFQLRAVIGYSYSHEPLYCGDSSNSFVMVGQSDWSNTRTITMSNPNP